MWCSDTGLCWPHCFLRGKKREDSNEKHECLISGLFHELHWTMNLFFVWFPQFILINTIFMERQRRLWKIKTIGLYFSNQQHFDLMCFFHLICFSFVCKLFNRKGWRQCCKSYSTPNPSSFGPMHLLSVCMNGFLSNWCTMLHYIPQWGSLQVR